MRHGRLLAGALVAGLASLAWWAAAGPPAGPLAGAARTGQAAAAPAAGAATAPAPAPARPAPLLPQDAAHGGAELDCRNCHLSKHHGVIRMYLGVGGRGAPSVPSHMAEVRVECIACHVAGKEGEDRAGLVGQTFKATEQACVNCHDEKYRGMAERWVTAFAKMQETVRDKLEAARAAVGTIDAKNAGHVRARRLVDDAEANLRFVTLARGVHNVFYAADLLKLANGWADEALALMGRLRGKADDALVRGGYCGVLCHEQAGVKRKDTVTFARQKVPHDRHVTEFGAVCTACHSADTHKKMTATRATCTGCHHAPANDRCEGCHQSQTALYRGTLRSELAQVEPNVMAKEVGCTGCHDFRSKHSREAVGKTCLECHDKPYLALMPEWTADFDRDVGRLDAMVKRAEAALAGARKAGRVAPEAEALARQAREAVELVRAAKGAHNPVAADDLLRAARARVERALAALGAS